jgi:hypothetical protein
VHGNAQRLAGIWLGVFLSLLIGDMAAVMNETCVLIRVAAKRIEAIKLGSRCIV